MDLIGEFYPPMSKGHQYALTIVDMLTGFIFCALLKSKKAEEIVQAYLNEVYYRFGGPRKICLIMAQNLKTRCSEKCQKNLDVK